MESEVSFRPIKRRFVSGYFSVGRDSRLYRRRQLQNILLLCSENILGKYEHSRGKLFFLISGVLLAHRLSHTMRSMHTSSHGSLSRLNYRDMDRGHIEQ